MTDLEQRLRDSIQTLSNARRAEVWEIFREMQSARPSMGEVALHWQQIADEFCEFNKYADRTIMHNFAGWLASRGIGLGASVAVSSSGLLSAERTDVQMSLQPTLPQERCPVCGGIVHEVHPKHDVWVHDDCWGEYIAICAEFYGDED